MMASTILVVDDDAGIVALTTQILAHHGYKVLCATDPRQALQMVQGDSRVDLVVSDVLMPEMQGPELIQAIRQLSPATAAILMSGYVGSEAVPREIPFLQKPLSFPKLLAAVERALASREADALPPRRQDLPESKPRKRPA